MMGQEAARSSTTSGTSSDFVPEVLGIEGSHALEVKQLLVDVDGDLLVAHGTAFLVARRGRASPGARVRDARGPGGELNYVHVRLGLAE